MQYPAYGTTSARTASFEYAVGGNPLKLTATDPAGAITTETDLLGRAVKYTDVWGMVTTTTYNRLGQATSSQTTTTAGTSSTDLTYNTDGQVETVKISGILLADPSYTNGQLTSVAYGNGTALSGITRNLAGATTGGVTWAFPSSQPEVTDTVYRSQSAGWLRTRPRRARPGTRRGSCTTVRAGLRRPSFQDRPWITGSPGQAGAGRVRVAG